MPSGQDRADSNRCAPALGKPRPGAFLPQIRRTTTAPRRSATMFYDAPLWVLGLISLICLAIPVVLIVVLVNSLNRPRRRPRYEDDDDHRPRRRRRPRIEDDDDDD